MKLRKYKSRLRDFLYDVFHLQGKTGKLKVKNDEQNITYSRVHISSDTAF